jgi:hypothetical protein
MIDRYTIKFGPAVSQKELERIISTGEGNFRPDDLKKMKVRIELICDFEDLKRIQETIKAAEREGPQ